MIDNLADALNELASEPPVELLREGVECDRVAAALDELGLAHGKVFVGPKAVSVSAKGDEAAFALARAFMDASRHYVTVTRVRKMPAVRVVYAALSRRGPAAQRQAA